MDYLTDRARFQNLRKPTGIRVDELIKLHNYQNVILWGAGAVGRSVMKTIKNQEIKRFYCDESGNENCAKDGYFVVDKIKMISLAKKEKSLIILCFSDEINTQREFLSGQQLVSGKDFISYFSLKREEAVIEVCGADGKSMSLGAFKKNMGHLLIEYPDLYQVDLSGLGNPLGNRSIINIIKHCEDRLSTVISVPILGDFKKIKQLLTETKATLVCLVISGAQINFAKEYSNLIVRLENFFKFKKQHSEVIFPVVRIRFDAYADNVAYFDQLSNLCAKHGVIIKKAIGYPENYDSLRELITNRDGYFKIKMKLLWDVTRIQEIASNDDIRNCHCERIFPIINAHNDVTVCHLYRKYTISGKFLEMKRSELESKRDASTHCRECQKLSMHRIDVEYLIRRNQYTIN